jgi:hypothetical protein
MTLGIESVSIVQLIDVGASVVDARLPTVRESANHLETQVNISKCFHQSNWR